MKKNKSKMAGHFSLIIALIVEAVLLILILLVMIVGVMGVFLPFLPGLFIFGLAAGIYSLLVKKGYGRVTPKVHVKVLKLGNFVNNLEITKKVMFKINIFKKKKQVKVFEEILKNGIILFGFNLALILLFLFGSIGASLLARIFDWQGFAQAFMPLLFLFGFAAGSAIVWFRFGQLMGKHFDDNKIINSSLVVLISVLPILSFILLFSGIISLVGGFSNEFLAVAFLSFFLMSVLAAVFEMLIVSLGIITKVK